MLDEKLKRSRVELHLTQQEVADKLHISRQTISNWEVGNSYPDVPALIDLSELYQISLDYMLKDDTEYVKKVRNDYQLIDHMKKNSWLDKAVVISIILLFVPILFTPFIHTRMGVVSMMIAIFIFILPLMYFSYRKYLSFFKNIPRDNQPLMVPKVYGMGVGINPRHPIGRLIWIAILIFIIVSFGIAIYQALTVADIRYMIN